MKQISQSIFLFLLLLVGQSVWAQNGIGHVTLLKKNEKPTTAANEGRGRNGHVTLLKKNALLVYLGGGIATPSATIKEAGLVNGTDLNLSVYKPIWFWNSSNISLGVNAGGSYTSGNSEYNLDNRYTVYNLQGESAPPVVTIKESGSPKASGYKFEAGPQLNIHFGNFTLSPIFNLGYLSVTQKEFAVAEKLFFNGSEYDYNLLTQKETKTNGLAMVPKLRMAYNITPRIGIWIEGNYLLGPEIETESTRFTLDPSIPSDSYNLGHFQEGKYITTRTQSKYSSLGLNAGILIGLGNPNPKEPRNPETSQIETPSTGTVSHGETLAYRVEKTQDDQQYSNCLVVENPKNGSSQNTNEPLKINIKIDKERFKGAPSVTIYKISNDITYWNKTENLQQLMSNNDVLQKNSFEKESKATGFTPLTVNAKQNNGQLESTIDSGKLPQGAYKLVVSNDCGVTSSNFIVSSGALTTVALAINCKANFGDYNYTFTVKNTGTNSVNTTSIPAFNTTGGTLSGFTIAPALPVVIPAGGTQTFTGSFSYTGSYPNTALATVSGHQVGNPAYTSSDTEPGEIKPCICNFCEKAIKFDSNIAPPATFNATNNSIRLSQELWAITGKTLVGVKAEIISFERVVSDDCMKCNKNSNQWGNFIGGNSGSTAGTFTSVNDSGVTGNTHHSLYFYPPNNSKYDMEIAIPPLTSLSCCCDKMKFKIRYTHIFKEANGECKMCPIVLEYEYSNGTCPAVPPTQPGGPYGPWREVKASSVFQTTNN